MEVSVFSDPVKCGPGIWFKMHTDAVKAITDSLKEAFVINTNNTCDNFKCKTCQPHFRKFIDTHSFKNYWNIYDDEGRDIGMFQWTHELHNEVNKRLGKYQPTLKEAYEFYADSEAGACFNCGHNENTTSEQRTRAIPPILTLYRESGLKPQPFKLISRS